MKKPNKPNGIDAATVRNPAMVAAKGDDSLMSQAQTAVPSATEVAGLWKQQMGAAKIAWGKLTHDELLQVQGHAQKLAGLVQERYALSRDEARAQVDKFFDQHKH